MEPDDVVSDGSLNQQLLAMNKLGAESQSLESLGRAQLLLINKLNL